MNDEKCTCRWINAGNAKNTYRQRLSFGCVIHKFNGMIGRDEPTTESRGLTPTGEAGSEMRGEPCIRKEKSTQLMITELQAVELVWMVQARAVDG